MNSNTIRELLNSHLVKYLEYHAKNMSCPPFFFKFALDEKMFSDNEFSDCMDDFVQDFIKLKDDATKVKPTPLPDPTKAKVKVKPKLTKLRDTK